MRPFRVLIGYPVYWSVQRKEYVCTAPPLLSGSVTVVVISPAPPSASSSSTSKIEMPIKVVALLANSNEVVELIVQFVAVIFTVVPAGSGPLL